MILVKNGAKMGLEQCYLFSRLSPVELEELRQITRSKSYPKSTLLFYAGEKPEKLHLIESGTVRILKHDAAGNEITLADFHDDDLVAEMAHFEGIPYPATARCESDTVLYEIDFDSFKSRFLNRPELALGIIRSLTRKIKQLEEVIRRTLIDDAQTRLVRYLLEHEQALERMTQKQIAARIALTPETVSRVLRRMKDEGWVEVRGGKIHVKDRGAMLQFAEKSV